MLSPDEIVARDFLVSLRGYDREEVDAFLHEVAEDMRTLQDRAEPAGDGPPTRTATPAEARPAEAEELDRSEAWRALGEETSRVLMAADEQATEIRERAEQTAAELISNAEDEARALVEDAKRDARQELQDARQSATRIVTEAEQERDRVASERRDIEQARDELRRQLEEARSGVEQALGELGGQGAEVPAERPEQQPARDRNGAVARAVAPAEALAETESDEDSGTHPSSAPEPEQTADDARDEQTTDELAVEDALVATPEVDTTGEILEMDDEELEAEAEAEAAAEVADIETEAQQVPAGEAGGKPGALREQTLATVRPGMLRRVKRALQDVQNDTLTSIREAGDNPELSRLMPDESSLESLDSIGDMFLTAAFRGGTGDGATLAGKELGTELGDGSTVTGIRSNLRTDLSQDVMSSLSATLQAGLDADEPEPVLSERIGEVFRDLKGPVIEGLVDQALVASYSHGILAAFNHLGVDRVDWVLAEETRCPAGVCRTNAAEGSVPPGEQFPSGHPVPPAHDGCECTLAPGGSHG